MKKIILLFVAVFLVAAMIPLASAVVYPNPNFTPIFDTVPPTGADEVHYNITKTIDDIGGYVNLPMDLWVLVFVSGFSLLILSLVLTIKQGIDYMAIMSLIFTVIAGVCSRSIDVVTGMGVTSQIESQAPNGQINLHEYVLMEHHTLYHPEPLTFLCAILFVIGIINLYRIYLLHKTAESAETDNGKIRKANADLYEEEIGVRNH